MTLVCSQAAVARREGKKGWAKWVETPKKPKAREVAREERDSRLVVKPPVKASPAVNIPCKLGIYIVIRVVGVK